MFMESVPVSSPLLGAGKSDSSSSEELPFLEGSLIINKEC